MDVKVYPVTGRQRRLPAGCRKVDKPGEANAILVFPFVPQKRILAAVKLAANHRIPVIRFTEGKYGTFFSILDLNGDITVRGSYNLASLVFPLEDDLTRLEQTIREVFAEAESQGRVPEFLAIVAETVSNLSEASGIELAVPVAQAAIVQQLTAQPQTPKARSQPIRSVQVVPKVNTPTSSFRPLSVTATLYWERKLCRGADTRLDRRYS